MLLVRCYINGSWHYISDLDQVAHVAGTTYRQYLAGIIAMDEIRVATEQPWGGHAELEYGTITLSPEVFALDWPPPAKFDIRVCYGSAGESDEVMLLMGSAYLQEVQADGVVYGLYPPSLPTMVSDQLFYGSLLTLFAAHCATLGLNLVTGCYDAMDSYWPAGPDPIIEYQATGDRLLIALLAEMAAWTCYRFTIRGSDLVLVHTSYSNGPTLWLEAYDILATSYPASQPYVRYECEGEKSRPVRWRLVPDQLQNPARTAVAFAELKVRWIYEEQWHNPSALACADATPLYPLTNLWDNNASTFWAADFPLGDTGVAQYLIFETSGYYIDTYRLHARNDSYYDQAPASWRLDAWDANTSRWRKAMNVEAQAWTIGGVQEFPAPEVQWAVVADGNFAFGSVCTVNPSCNWYYADKLASLEQIRTLVEQHRARVQLPLVAGKIPAIGQRVCYTDETLRVSTQVDMKVAAITYNFQDHTCVIEGEATLSV